MFLFVELGNLYFKPTQPEWLLHSVFPGNPANSSEPRIPISRIAISNITCRYRVNYLLNTWNDLYKITQPAINSIRFAADRAYTLL